MGTGDSSGTAKWCAGEVLLRYKYGKPTGWPTFREKGISLRALAPCDTQAFLLGKIHRNVGLRLQTGIKSNE